MRLCILGFDALDSKLFEQSELPNFAWLRKAGQWGTLHSDEMRTAPCWTSILTGLEIEAHGVTDLLGYPRNRSNWFLGRARDYIFDILHNEGYSIGVSNFPSLVYSREIGEQDHARSWLMAGWPKAPTIRSSFTYEPNITLDWDLFTDLPDYERRVLDKHKPKGANEDWAIHEMPWDEYIEWAKTNAFKRLQVIESLPKVDVLMIQESVLDRAGHMLSTPNKGKLGTEDPRYKQALQLVGSLIGYARDKYNPDYISVVSDHGFQGISEADPKKGCWHSRRGMWAIAGPNILKIRNNTLQVNYTPTILDAIGISHSRDGNSVLITESGIDHTARGLGYI